MENGNPVLPQTGLNRGFFHYGRRVLHTLLQGPGQVLHRPHRRRLRGTAKEAPLQPCGIYSQGKGLKLAHSETYPSKKEAYARERQVKAWKSRIKIEIAL